MAMGGAFFRFWRGMIFFPPTSHLVCLFRPNKRETERHRSSADDRDGSGVGQCACTHTHTHTQTHRTRATDGRGPNMLPVLEPGPVGRPPPWPHWGSIDTRCSDRLWRRELSPENVILLCLANLSHVGNCYMIAFLWWMINGAIIHFPNAHTQKKNPFWNTRIHQSVLLKWGTLHLKKCCQRARHTPMLQTALATHIYLFVIFLLLCYYF